MTIITRRNALIGGAGLLLSGCDRIAASPSVREVLTLGEKATRTAQRIVTDRNALAREFTRADLSPVFRENGTRNPGSPDYAAHAARTLRQLASGGRRHGRPATCDRPGADPRRAAAHPDHPARLRGRVERDRPVDGTTAGSAAAPRRAIRQREVHRVPLRRSL
jgi:hypothetical protein